MANPYSAPSRFTYTPLPLDKLAEVLGKKQEKFDAAQAAGADALAKLNFKSGLIVNEDIVNARENEYREKLKTVSANLLKHKNPAQFNQELSTVLGEMNNDKLLADAELDAQMMPKLLEARNLYGDEGWYKWEKDGKVIDYNTDVVSAGKDISSFYQSMQGADYLAEMELASKVPPQEIQKVADAVYDPRMGKWISKTTNTEIRDLSEDSLAWLDFTQRAYESGSTLSAKSDKLKGLTADQYRKNTLDHIGIFGVNNYKENVAFIDDGESGGGSKKSLRGVTPEVVKPPDYLVKIDNMGVHGLVSYDPKDLYGAKNRLTGEGGKVNEVAKLEAMQQNSAGAEAIAEQKALVANLELTASIVEDATEDYYEDNPKVMDDRNKKLGEKYGWTPQQIDWMLDKEGGQKELAKYEALIYTEEQTSPGSRASARSSVRDNTDYKNLVFNNNVLNEYYNENIKPGLESKVNEAIMASGVQENRSFTINWGSGLDESFKGVLSNNLSTMLSSGDFDYDQSQVLISNDEGVKRNREINTTELQAGLRSALASEDISEKSIRIETQPDGTYISFDLAGDFNEKGQLRTNKTTGAKGAASYKSDFTTVRMKMNPNQGVKPGTSADVFFDAFEKMTLTDQKSSVKFSNLYGTGFKEYIADHISPITSGGKGFNLRNDFESKSEGKGGLSELANYPFISLSPVNQRASNKRSGSSTLGHIMYTGHDAKGATPVVVNQIYDFAQNSELGKVEIDYTQPVMNTDMIQASSVISTVVNSFLAADIKTTDGKSLTEQQKGEYIDSIYKAAGGKVSFNTLVESISNQYPSFSNSPFVFDNMEMINAFSFNN